MSENDLLTCNRFPTPFQETLLPQFSFGSLIRTKRKHYLYVAADHKIYLYGIGIFGVPSYRKLSVQHIVYGNDICNPENQKIILKRIKTDISFNEERKEIVPLLYEKPVLLKAGEKYLLCLDVHSYNTVRQMDASPEVCVGNIKFKFFTVHDIDSQTTAEYGNIPELYFNTVGNPN